MLMRPGKSEAEVEAEAEAENFGLESQGHVCLEDLTSLS